MEGQIVTYLTDKLGEEFSVFKVRRAVLSRAERKLYVECVFPRLLTDAEKRTVEEGLTALLPAGYAFETVFKRDYFDDEILTSEILDFIREAAAAVSARIGKDNLDIGTGQPVPIGLSMDETTYAFSEKQNLPLLLAEYLNGRHCASFAVRAVNLGGGDAERAKAEVLKRKEKLEQEAVSGPPRLITVEDRRPFIGKLVECGARYISDVSEPVEDIVFAGRVKGVRCRTTASGKTLFTFSLEDFTGSLPCSYFPSEQNAPRITDELKDGTEVIVRGNLRLDNFSRELRFMPRGITFCRLPENFVKPEPVGKPVPEEYTYVRPEKMVVGEQVPLFGEGPAESVTPGLAGKRFVVFDLETTGLEVKSCRITEIGAISIEDGEIAESFSTLVNPETFIPEEITRLTGITEDMVKGAPTIAQVVPDFYRFCDGATLVAHNIEFDYKFLDTYATECGYLFRNEQMDTLALARQELKGLGNYKLNTVSDYLGVDLKGHHRAINDVLATAHIFMKLMKMRDSRLKG